MANSIEVTHFGDKTAQRTQTKRPKSRISAVSLLLLWLSGVFSVNVPEEAISLRCTEALNNRRNRVYARNLKKTRDSIESMPRNKPSYVEKVEIHKAGEGPAESMCLNARIFLSAFNPANLRLDKLSDALAENPGGLPR